MQIDFGTGIVIVATLAFYLRLIIIQRQKVKRQTAQSQGKQKNKKSSYPTEQYSIVSRYRRDWIIAGTGIFVVALGVLLKAGVLPIASAAPYWWAPVALGIVACSWGFR